MGWSLPPRALGVWVKIPAVEVVEVLAAAGVDFIVLDREHGVIDSRSMTAMIAVARGIGLPCFVRVRNHKLEEVQPVLDAGASGLFVPHIDDAAAAEQMVDACRFPPLGHRHGSPTTRFGNWGATELTELVRRGNDEVMLVAQVETQQAVANIDDILRVRGFDAIFLGPFDLALSTGLAPNGPEFRSLVRRVESAASELPLGGVAAEVQGAPEPVARGYAFLMAGADTSLLQVGARTFVDRGAA